MKTLDVIRREDWRQWLVENHTKETEIGLVFHKKHTGESGVPYEETVEDALCFGWIDSIIKRLDEERFARKYTPRKPGSPWSELNKARAEKMIKEDRMTDAGLALINEAKSSGEWGQKRSRPHIPTDEIPQEFRNALADNPEAEKNFHALAPSYRKHYVLWIALAKRAQTRLRRVQEAIQKLERGERLGLK
jgi:uncharacterized protein YdeI (YjbR/CyaY-like superfamily)